MKSAALSIPAFSINSALNAVIAAGVGSAQAEDLTLCWAAWDPANALVELSKDFEAKSGHKMKFEFVPWPNFADRMLNELNSGGKLCDLLIGDSQWIGGAAENGQYVKLNDFFDKEGIKMDDFIPATVVGYAEWPKNSPNYASNSRPRRTSTSFRSTPHRATSHRVHQATTYVNLLAGLKTWA